MKRIVAIVIAIIVIFGTGYGVYVSLQNTQAKPKTTASQKDETAPRTEEAEAKYIANMLAQIQDVQTMLGMATAKAKHSELRGLAGSYMATTESEADVLNGWKTKWSYESTEADANRLPRYISGAEYTSMKQRLGEVTGDDFDKLFLEYLRVQLLADTQQSYTVEGKAAHPEVEEFADSVRNKRLQISTEQSEWPEQWGYVPAHDG